MYVCGYCQSGITLYSYTEYHYNLVRVDCFPGLMLFCKPKSHTFFRKGGLYGMCMFTNYAQDAFPDVCKRSYLTASIKPLLHLKTLYVYCIYTSGAAGTTSYTDSVLAFLCNAFCLREAGVS